MYTGTMNAEDSHCERCEFCVEITDLILQYPMAVEPRQNSLRT